MDNCGSSDFAMLDQRKLEHRALALLRFLDRQPGNKSNECIIAALFETIGLVCSRQQVRDDINRIEKLALIRSSNVGDLLVVSLLAKGEEVGNGRIVIDGVLRPGVDCPY
ncbi:VpaChn25_0724 family phage protein [Bradyrhizobium liaoningense]